jgi:hypothetical protein
MWNVNKESYRNWGIYEIDDWNMNVSVAGAATRNVAHNLTSWKKIRNVSAVVRSDGDTTYYAVPAANAGGTGTDLFHDSFTSTNIILRSRTGGIFDNAGFDATSYNRGWVYIEIEE